MSEASRRKPAAVEVAMIGAGPIARMTYQAAVDLGIDFVVLAADAGDSAVLAGAAHRLGSRSSLADMRAVAGGARVVAPVTPVTRSGW